MRRKRMAAAIISLAVVLSFVTSAFAVVDTYNNWRGFGIFEQGDSGGKVRAIQNITKYYLGKGTSYTADGAYGSRTTAAVKEYQRKRTSVQMVLSGRKLGIVFAMSLWMMAAEWMSISQ